MKATFFLVLAFSASVFADEPKRKMYDFDFYMNQPKVAEKPKVKEQPKKDEPVESKVTIIRQEVWIPPTEAEFAAWKRQNELNILADPVKNAERKEKLRQIEALKSVTAQIEQQSRIQTAEREALLRKQNEEIERLADQIERQNRILFQMQYGQK